MRVERGRLLRLASTAPTTTSSTRSHTPPTVQVSSSASINSGSSCLRSHRRDDTPPGPSRPRRRARVTARVRGNRGVSASSVNPRTRTRPSPSRTRDPVTIHTPFIHRFSHRVKTETNDSYPSRRVRERRPRRNTLRVRRDGARRARAPPRRARLDRFGREDDLDDVFLRRRRRRARDDDGSDDDVSSSSTGPIDERERWRKSSIRRHWFALAACALVVMSSAMMVSTTVAFVRAAADASRAVKVRARGSAWAARGGVERGRAREVSVVGGEANESKLEGE